MKRLFFPAAIVVVLFLLTDTLAGENEKPVNGEGVIYFRNGSSTRVDYFGTIDHPTPFVISGKQGGNAVKLGGTELAKIAFVNSKANYTGTGELEVVNRDGERFLITDVGIHFSNQDLVGACVAYVYTDPITKVRRATNAWGKDIQEIVIGPTAGRLRLNPITKERFPDFFMFDPYNGTRLVWTDDPNAIEIRAEAPVECRAVVVRKKPSGGKFVVPNVNLKLSYEAKAEAAVNVNTDGTGAAVFQVKPGVYNAELTVGTGRTTQKVVVGSDGLLVIEISE